MTSNIKVMITKKKYGDQILTSQIFEKVKFGPTKFEYIKKVSPVH